MKLFFLLVAVASFGCGTILQTNPAVPSNDWGLNLKQPFKDCNIQGSTTVYDLGSDGWRFTDSLDAGMETLPASTFKVTNLLIALKTGVIKSENDTVEWVGRTDTLLYGYRPEIYRNMTVKEAFEVSAGWVFIELAKKVKRERYRHYLDLSRYGNGKLSEKGDDFWNFGEFAISPIIQVEFLLNVFKGNTPFSRQNVETFKRVMITETGPGFVLRSKTGWTRVDGKNWEWWVGFVERKNNAYFFATRIVKSRAVANGKFAQCRKDITKEILL